MADDSETPTNGESPQSEDEASGSAEDERSGPPEVEDYALLTDWEREVISGEADVSKEEEIRADAAIRGRMGRLEEDVSILAECDRELLENVREIAGGAPRLVTKEEMDAIRGDFGEERRTEVRGRVRDRTLDRLALLMRVFGEHDPELVEEIRTILCEE